MNATSFEEFAADVAMLTGAQKTAALLLSLGKPLAGRLLKHFDETEMREVVKAAAQLGAVSRNTVEILIEEFTQDFSVGADLQGNVAEVEQLLVETLPAEKVADILSDVFDSPNSGIWEKIGNLPEEQFLNFLQKEHAQVAAFILSKIGASHAANLLSKSPRGFRNEVLKRMVALAPVSDKMLKLVETVLHERLIVPAARGPEKNSFSKVAEIVNQLEPTEAEDVMQSLAAAQPKAAASVKKMLFSFEDLLRLSSRARALLFDTLPSDVVIMALRGTDAAFRDVALSSMASRARRLVESELSAGTGTSQKDVVKARRQIAETVLKMAQRNEIELPSEEVDEAA